MLYVRHSVFDFLFTKPKILYTHTHTRHVHPYLLLSTPMHTVRAHTHTLAAHRRRRQRHAYGCVQSIRAAKAFCVYVCATRTLKSTDSAAAAPEEWQETDVKEAPRANRDKVPTWHK